MFVLSDASLEILKLLLLGITSVIAILGVATETKRQGKPTVAGYVVIAILMLSWGLSTWIQVVQNRREREARETARGRESEQLKRLEQVGTELSALNNKTATALGSLNVIDTKQRQLLADQSDLLAEEIKSSSPFEPFGISASLVWPANASEWAPLRQSARLKTLETGFINGLPENIVRCEAVRKAGERTSGRLPFTLCSHLISLYVSSRPLEPADYSRVGQDQRIAEWHFWPETPSATVPPNDSQLFLMGEQGIAFDFGPRSASLSRNDLSVSTVYDLEGKYITIDFGPELRSREAEDATPPTLQGSVLILYGRGLAKRLRLPATRFRMLDERPLSFSTIVTKRDLRSERALPR